MKDMISVIVPVYNVEKYLPQCVESIQNQDHRNLEILLIDDGSTDSSGAICDRYAAGDARIRVIHQKNGGAAAAKNAGLRVASGTYLSFVDSDDFLEPNVYGYMLKVLTGAQADAAQFAFRNVYQDRTEDQVVHMGRSVTDAKAYLARFTKDWTCALLWNKLYKRVLYNGVFFEEGHKIDDEYFTYQGFLNDCKIVCDDRIIYNYRKRASSVMSAPASAEQLVLDCLDAIAKRRERVVRAYPQLRKVFDENYLDVIWYLSGNTGGTEKTIDLLKSHLKAYLRTAGNTLPPRYLWKGLWKLYFTSTQALLSKKEKAEALDDIDTYFT